MVLGLIECLVGRVFQLESGFRGTGREGTGGEARCFFEVAASLPTIPQAAKKDDLCSVLRSTRQATVVVAIDVQLIHVSVSRMPDIYDVPKVGRRQSLVFVAAVETQVVGLDCS